MGFGVPWISVTFTIAALFSRRLAVIIQI